MVSCELVYGDIETLIIEAYLPPSNLYHVLDLEEAINRFLRRDIAVLRDLNVYIVRLKNPWDQKVVYLLASFGLVGLLVHF